MADTPSSETPTPEKKPAATSADGKTVRKKAPVKKATTKTAAAKPAKSKTNGAGKKATTPASRTRTGKKPATSAAKAAPVKASVEEKTMTSETTHPETENVSPENGNKTDNVFEDLKSRNWGEIVKRGLFMIFYGIASYLAIQIVLILVLIQFAVSVLSGQPNEQIKDWISWVGDYLVKALDFLSYKTEDKPFPFN